MTDRQFELLSARCLVDIVQHASAQRVAEEQEAYLLSPRKDNIQSTNRLQMADYANEARKSSSKEDDETRTSVKTFWPCL